MNEPLIQIRELCKSYGSFLAVDHLHFDVYSGDVFGFLGPNGAGKSSTIRMMLRLIHPSSGTIRLFGEPLTRGNHGVLRRIGCIVEKPDFYPYLSAEKNLNLFASLSGVAITKYKVHETLDFVGLSGRANDAVKNYSHGMKQRLGIAQTLLHDPDLIILDEPTTGLDPQGIIDIRNLILRLRDEKKKTVLLSSHILTEIELIATRMVIIHKGRTIAEGSVSELLNEGDRLVSLRVEEPEKAETVLKAGPWTMERSGDRLNVSAAEKDIPEINRKLVSGGVRVLAIESKRKLEDYFLNLVGNA